MKQFGVRRVLPFILILSLLLPVITIPTFALADFPDSLVDSNSVNSWNRRLSCTNTAAVDAALSAFGISGSAQDLFWFLVNTQIYNRGVGSRSEKRLLYYDCDAFESLFTSNLQSDFWRQIVDGNRAIAAISLQALYALGPLNFDVAFDSERGVYRIKETTNNIWVVASDGTYPYFEESASDPDPQPGWIPVNTIYNSILNGSGSGSLYSQRRLENLESRLSNSGIDCWIAELGSSGMMVIFKSGYIYCDEDKRPYYYWKSSQSAVSQDRPTTDIVTNDGNTMEPADDLEVGIDVDNQFVLLPSSDIVITGEILYDVEDKTYTVETYNYETNNFEYSYTYEYYIQNTTVTYIGETMDFEKYECYYKLPDGRNSADLTREELEQLNVGIDVVEYSRSTDDVRLRALYHFDGDTKDSSYWNHLSEFHWHEGATITYMDVETFGGAMYLDANIDSAFSIKLPSSLGSGDFTIQFRYYQSQPTAASPTSGLYMNATPKWGWNPAKDSAAEPLALLTGEELWDEPDSNACDYSVGSWNEICITRKGDTFSYFVNGLCLFYTSWFDTKTFNDTLMFYFGEDMGAYKMIDELRVLNFAIASGKQAEYEPTAVPHDTNLALVLPDDKVAIADEYWTFESSKENILEQYGLADWQGFGYGNISPYLEGINTDFILNTDGSVSAPGYPDSFNFSQAFYNQSVYSLLPGRNGLSFEVVCDSELFDLVSGTKTNVTLDSGRSVPFSGLFIPVFDLPDGYYTFSVYANTDVRYYFVFQLTNGKRTALTPYRVGSNSDGIGCVNLSDGAFLYVKSDSDAFEVLYMQLVSGSGTDLTATYNGEIAIIDKEDQFKPTLAVRTDLEITDYQIGGVRPTIPEKGLVYAMVESGYITSLQIYNGQAWEACDGRIWTGERWIPYSSYNVITLQDMYDIVDATPDFEYIYTEAGFWAWWQRTWNEFTAKLFSLLGSGTGTGDDGELDLPVEVVDPENEGILSFWEFIKLLLNGGKAVFSGFRQLFSGVVSMVPDSVESFTGALAPGGVAVSIFENRDPDFDIVAVWDLDSLDYYQTEEALDPWRYR